MLLCYAFDKLSTNKLLIESIQKRITWLYTIFIYLLSICLKYIIITMKLIKKYSWRWEVSRSHGGLQYKEDSLSLITIKFKIKTILSNTVKQTGWTEVLIVFHIIYSLSWWLDPGHAGIIAFSYWVRSRPPMHSLFIIWVLFWWKNKISFCDWVIVWK